MDDKKMSVTVELIKDYEFKVVFDDLLPEFLMDEPAPLGAGNGPNASRVLAAAVGNCLSASLLFCLRKVRVEPTALKTTVFIEAVRNEQKRLRLESGLVSITVAIEPELKTRLHRCLDLFEDYCVVTQSVRAGIDVSVEVKEEGGEVLYDSRDHK